MHVASPCACASSLALLALQTNNSTKTRAVNALKLAEHGITASAEEVVSSAYVTARYMADSGLVAGDKVYVIGEVRPSWCPPPLMCDVLLSFLSLFGPIIVSKPRYAHAHCVLW